MTNNIQLDEGASGKYTETEEVTSNIHRQAVKVAGVGACQLTKGKTITQIVTCTAANTDYVVAAALAVGSKYLSVYCSVPFIVAMGEVTSATVGVGLAGGTWVFPTTRTGVTADDKLHMQSSTAGAVVRVTEMGD